MAEISMNVAANALRTMTTIASPAKEASSVSKTVTKKKVTAEQTKKQERVQEDNIERDIVAVSKDGDTVAVSKESVVDVQKTNEVKEKDKITIRGKGRFKIDEIMGNTKKGKINIKIEYFS